MRSRSPSPIMSPTSPSAASTAADPWGPNQSLHFLVRPMSSLLGWAPSEFPQLQSFSKRHPRHAVILKDVSVAAWDSLLIIHNTSAFEKPAKELDAVNWELVIEAATKLGFEDIRKQAIAALERHLAPFTKIDLGFKLKIPGWIHEAYCELCEREESLTLEEAERLGLRRLTAICRIRDEVHRRRLEELKKVMGSRADARIGDSVGGSSLTSTICGEGENEGSPVEKMVVGAEELKVSLMQERQLVSWRALTDDCSFIPLLSVLHETSIDATWTLVPNPYKKYLVKWAETA